MKDTDNSCVHLLEMDGIFKAYVEHLKIRGIGVMSLDENERLWIANYKGRQIYVFISISSEYKISNVVLSEVTVYSKPKKDQLLYLR